MTDDNEGSDVSLLEYDVGGVLILFCKGRRQQCKAVLTVNYKRVDIL